MNTSDSTPTYSPYVSPMNQLRLLDSPKVYSSKSTQYSPQILQSTGLSDYEEPTSSFRQRYSPSSPIYSPSSPRYSPSPPRYSPKSPSFGRTPPSLTLPRFGQTPPSLTLPCFARTSPSYSPSYTEFIMPSFRSIDSKINCLTSPQSPEFISFPQMTPIFLPLNETSFVAVPIKLNFNLEAKKCVKHMTRSKSYKIITRSKAKSFKIVTRSSKK